MVKETFGRLDRLSQADAELRGPAAHRESRSDADQGGDRLTDPLALVESFSVAKEDIATPAEPSDLDVRELYRTAPPMEGERVATGLPVGTKAPDFTLPDKDGTPVSLEALRGRPVALVFYPLDWSPGCSVQLELYQQEYEEFADRGVELLGISVDSIYSHGAWAAVRGISYPLLSDFHPRGEVARKYRVWREGDGFSERAIYLIDAEGIIRWVHVSPQLHHLPHFDDLVAALDLVASAPEEKSVEPERSVTT